MAKSTTSITANAFLKNLHAQASETELSKYQRIFKDEKFIGVKMGQIFKLAKEFDQMPISEVEKLLKNEIHEARVGAVSIMDYQARDKKATTQHRQELFNLYIDQHDQINTWDLVDRSVIWVVGDYLVDKPREILYQLASSQDPMRRRSAIVATAALIRENDLADTFQIAEILLKDENELVHKGVGWMLRFAGDKDKKQLIEFLDKYATRMPRIMLRYAIEKLDKAKRDYYLKLK